MTLNITDNFVKYSVYSNQATEKEKYLNPLILYMVFLEQRTIQGAWRKTATCYL